MIDKRALNVGCIVFTNLLLEWDLVRRDPALMWQSLDLSRKIDKVLRGKNLINSH
jgi:hypothetical protein